MKILTPKPGPGIFPGRSYRVARRLTQGIVLVVLLVAPFLGGWQRLDRNLLSAWDGHGWDLPGWALDALPLGDAPLQAYTANQALGGGAAGALVGIPAADPVAGLVAMMHGPWSWLLLLAWGIPLLLSLVAGRAWCGWLCPFGTLARILDALLERLPWRPPALRLPRRRPLRWAVLGATVLVGFLGAQTLLYLFLPHVLVQMSGYAFWLMGGGGALLGWLLGLLLVGLVFGPTAYCAAVCPTGAALSAPSRISLFKVFIADKADCGRACTLCTRACWLQLDPASGDPGPDCDLCARCFGTCPKVNLRVGLRRSAPRVLPVLLAGLLAPGFARADRPKPRLLLDTVTRVAAVEAAVGIVDLEGIRLDADDRKEERGVEITVHFARGAYGAPDEYGKLPARDFYAGPLTIELVDRRGVVMRTLEFPKANSPRSTPRRRLYRVRVDLGLEPGDSVVVRPIPDWLPDGVRWTLSEYRPGRRHTSLLEGFVAGFLIFGGLLALAVAVPDPSRRR